MTAAGISLLFAAISSCGTSDTSHPAADFAINLTPGDSSLTLSDYFAADYDIIKLDGATVGYISDLIVTDSAIYVTSISQEGLLLQFDSEGQFIKTLLTKGQGPDEVLNLQRVRSDGDYLYCLCDFGKVIKRYSTKESAFDSTFTVPAEILYPDDFIKVGDNLVFFKSKCDLENDSTQYHLYVYDTAGESVKERYSEIDREASEYISVSPPANFCPDTDGGALFIKAFADGIIRIDSKGNIADYITFKTNEYTFPEEKLHGKNTFMQFIEYCMESDYMWAFNRIRTDGSTAFFGFQYKNNPYLAFLDRDSGVVATSSIVNDDIFAGSGIPVSEWGTIVCADRGRVFVSYPFSAIEQARASSGKLQRNPLVSALTADDNELIVAFHTR